MGLVILWKLDNRSSSVETSYTFKLIFLKILDEQKFGIQFHEPAESIISFGIHPKYGRRHAFFTIAFPSLYVQLSLVFSSFKYSLASLLSFVLFGTFINVEIKLQIHFLGMHYIKIVTYQEVFPVCQNKENTPFSPIISNSQILIGCQLPIKDINIAKLCEKSVI